jgi:hypothetical protein
MAATEKTLSANLEIAVEEKTAKLTGKKPIIYPASQRESNNGSQEVNDHLIPSFINPYQYPSISI